MTVEMQEEGVDKVVFSIIVGMGESIRGGGGRVFTFNMPNR